jgi:hypothetical protein
LSLPSVLATLSAATPRDNLALKRGQQLFSRVCKAETTPVLFVYNGVTYRGLGKLKTEGSNITEQAGYKRATLSYWLDSNVRVRLEAALCEEYGQVEYTLWFENTGMQPSGVLDQVRSVNINFAGADPVVRGCLGDHENRYAPYEKHLPKDTASFRSDVGRATHVCFPYFDLVHGNGGTLLAFRQETCEEPAHVVRLPFAKPGVAYRLFNEDSKETFVVDGGKLRSEGFTVTIGEPKSSAVFHIKANID